MTHVEVGIHPIMPKSGIVFLYYQFKSRFPLQKGWQNDNDCDWNYNDVTMGCLWLFYDEEVLTYYLTKILLVLILMSFNDLGYLLCCGE
jgi:hypothetical protein